MNSRSFPQRGIAYKLYIKDIKSGNFFIENIQDKKITYLMTPFGLKVNRVRIWGDVVHKKIKESEQTGNVASVSIVVNDGTEAILVVAFLESQYNTKFIESIKIAQELEIGNRVDVVGRLRKRDENILIIPEIIRKIENPNFESLRELEILYLKSMIKKEKEKSQGITVTVRKREEEKSFDTELSDLEEELESDTSLGLTSSRESDDSITKILSLIEKIDEGEGVTIKEISTYTNISIDKLESILKVLFEDGTIYEPKKGKFRKL